MAMHNTSNPFFECWNAMVRCLLCPPLLMDIHKTQFTSFLNCTIRFTMPLNLNSSMTIKSLMHDLLTSISAIMNDVSHKYDYNNIKVRLVHYYSSPVTQSID